jgi:hypothetical protein
VRMGSLGTAESVHVALTAAASTGSWQPFRPLRGPRRPFPVLLDEAVEDSLPAGPNVRLR